jgi:hypothetical protein
VQHFPEAISRFGKMQPGRAGIKAGINTAKQDLQIVIDEVGDGAVYGIKHIFFGGFEIYHRGKVLIIFSRIPRISRVIFFHFLMIR